MKAKLWDERGVVSFEPEDVKEISVEVGGYSILVTWNNGECDRAEWVSI